MSTSSAQNLDIASAGSSLRSGRNSRQRIESGIMFGLCTAFTLIIMSMLALVLFYLVPAGIKALNVAFFTKAQINQGDSGYPGGMLHGLYGTFSMVAMAAALGIPIGLMAGVYLSEYGTNSRFARCVRFVADVLAGVPSIVVGVLGYELLVRPLGHFSGYAGAAGLAFIMIPIVARTTEEMLRLVPQSYREGSIALGASKARTIIKVIIPSATGSLITGLMLAVARVAGETAPLLFTAGGLASFESNPAHPFPSLTQQIYQYVMEGTGEQKSVGQAGILVLISMIFVFNLSVRLVAGRKSR